MSRKKYRIDYDLVKRLSAEQLTQKQIARILKIPISTFETYIFKDKELHLALKEGKATPNTLVEQSLFRNALGFPNVKKTYTRREIKNVLPDGNVELISEMVLDKIVEEHTAGNVAAQQYWLQCNYPEKYRQRIDINHSFANMSKVGNNG